MKINLLATIDMYRKVWSYEELEKTVRDYEAGSRASKSSQKKNPKNNAV